MAADRGGIPPITLQQIRDTVDIVDVVSRYVTLSKTGQNFRGLCPFHNEKTPSFTVNASRQMYYCFGCGKGGDVFSFLMNRERMNFVEAVTELAQQVNIEIPQFSFSRSSKNDLEQRKTLENLNALASTWFQRNLHDAAQGRGALIYLQNRGLTLNILKEFRVGYAVSSWDALSQHLQRNGAKVSELIQAGLVVAKEGRGHEVDMRKSCYDRFRDRVMVPIRDLKGATVAFGGRQLGEGTPKYLNSPETPLFQKGRCLFGLDQARNTASQQNSLLVVEGYFDVLMLHQFGICNVVAPLGTALTRDHVVLIRRFVKNVVLMFDGDAAGIGATLRTMDAFLNSGVTVKVAQLPDGEDPDSFVQNQGAERFLELEQRACPLIEFALEQSLTGAVENSVEERMRRVDDVLRILTKVSNPIEKEEYLKQVSERLGIRQSLLMERFPMLASRGKNPVARWEEDMEVSANRSQQCKETREECDLVLLLVHGMLEPAQVVRLREEDFAVPEYRRLVELSLRHVDEQGCVNVQGLLDEAGVDPVCAALAAKLAVSEEHFDNCEDYINGCLDALDRRRLKTALDGLIAKLRIAERENRADEVQAINAKIESLREHKAGLVT